MPKPQHGPVGPIEPEMPGTPPPGQAPAPVEPLPDAPAESNPVPPLEPTPI